MEGLGLAGVLTGLPPVRGGAVQIPEHAEEDRRTTPLHTGKTGREHRHTQGRPDGNTVTHMEDRTTTPLHTARTGQEHI